MVPRIQISPAGPEFSRLAYGTWRMLEGATPPTTADVANRLQACVELGLTTIDTAEIYGLYRVEAALGAALRSNHDLRSKLQIVTKCGIDVPSPEKSHATVNHYDASSENIIACAEKSLRLLETDYLDLLLVHRPDWLTAAADTAKGLNHLVKSGKIRYAGVSNYSVDQFDALNQFVDQPLVTNQIETSLLHLQALVDGTLDQCQRLKICPMGWSPLAQGRLFDAEIPSSDRLQRLVDDHLTNKYDASLDQLAVAWLLAHPAQIVPIVGTNQLARIRSAAAACEIALSRQDWYAMWEAAQGHAVP